MRKVMESAIQRILEEELTSFLEAESHEGTQTAAIDTPPSRIPR